MDSRQSVRSDPDDADGTDTPVAPSPGGPSPGWRLPLIKVGAAVIAVVVLAVVEPAIITGTLNSPQAMLIIAGFVAAVIGWSALLRWRGVRNPLRAVLVLIPTAVILGVYVAPYFGPDLVVDEEFPVALAPSTEGEDDGADPVADAPVTDGVASPAPTGSEGDHAAADGTGPPGPDPTTDPLPTSTPTATPTATPTPTPLGPVELSRGTFVGLDNHRATGDAAIYDLGDGRSIVRLEDVDLHRVPQPVVYLVPVADAEQPVEGSVDLGPLTGNVGSSNYEVPADVDLSDGDWTVLVWCVPFASPVGAATQLPTI